MSNFNNSRRDFLKLMGLGTAALALPRFKFFPSADSYEANIGLQLYSVRKAIVDGFEGTMKKVADTGYLGIESYTLPENLSLDRAAKVFRDLDLKVFSMHSELPVGDARDLALKMADAYKCDTLVYHGWPEGDKYKNEANIKLMVDVHDEIAAFLKKNGLRYGLHNHWWDFEKNDDGIVPFYYLLEHLDNDVFFEIDTYWAKVAGQDPTKIIQDFGKRAPLLHIKDGPAVHGEKGYEQVPAGKGVLDFPSIVKAGGDNIKWMIVEFDEYGGDIFDGIGDSYSYLTKNKLAKGKV
ncbi:MAG TPA: TIM barrel protein [Candidatus Kryptonia bacterium]